MLPLLSFLIPFATAILCAFGWIALGTVAGYDAPWFGWLVGAVVGGATWCVFRNSPSRRRGVWTMACALLATLLGLYTLSALKVEHLEMQQQMLSDDSESYLWSIATDIVEQWEAEGKKLDWPPGSDVESALFEEDFPADVWQAARGRWESLSPGEQEEEKLFQKTLKTAMETQFHAAGSKQRLIAREIAAFTPPVSFLFIALGLFTAYRLGAGFGKNEASSPEDAKP